MEPSCQLQNDVELLLIAVSDNTLFLGHQHHYQVSEIDSQLPLLSAIIIARDIGAMEQAYPYHGLSYGQLFSYQFKNWFFWQKGCKIFEKVPVFATKLARKYGLAVGMAMAVEAMPDPTSMITAQKMTNTSEQDAERWNEGAT